MISKKEALEESHDYFYAKHPSALGLSVNASIKEVEKDKYIVVNKLTGEILKTKK